MTSAPINSALDRRHWLNAILELQTVGLSYRGELSSLLASSKVATCPLSKTIIPEAVTSLAESDFLKVLLFAPESREVFALIREKQRETMSKPSSFISTLSDSISAWISSASYDSYAVTHLGADKVEGEVSEMEERDNFVFLFGVAALLAFFQVNYTGVALPSIPSEDESFSSIIFSDFIGKTENTQFFLESLETNGEDVYTCIYHPFLLSLALSILSPANGVFSKRHLYPMSTFSLPIASLWALRALSALHDSLIDSTEFVLTAINSLFSSLAVNFSIPALLNTAMNLDDGDEDQDEDQSSILSKARSQTACILLPEHRTHFYSSPTLASTITNTIDATVALEASKISRKYWQHKRCELLQKSAKSLAGFECQLTGVMGKNTRHQKSSHAQLMVAGQTKTDMIQAAPQEGAVNIEVSLIEDVPLDTYDEVLLALPTLDDTTTALGSSTGDYESIFSALAQSWLINHADYVQMTNARTDLTNYEMLAYVNAPLHQQLRLDGVSSFNPANPDASMTSMLQEGQATLRVSSDEHTPTLVQGETEVFSSFEKKLLIQVPWGVHLKALQLRSMLEVNEPRKNIRAMVQLESIGNQFSTQLGLYGPAIEALSPKQRHLFKQDSKDVLLERASWRLNNIFTSGVAPWWIHKRTYADYAISAGLRQSALDAFVQIGLWERVIEAYIELGRKSQAEMLVRSRLPNNGSLVCQTDDSSVAISSEAHDLDNEAVSDAETDMSMFNVTEVEEEMDNLSLGDSQTQSTLSDNETDTGSVSDEPFMSLDEQSEVDTAVKNRFANLGKKVQSEKTRAAAYRRGLDLPEHKLWALLGDITGNREYYKQSWKSSNGTYPKAKRCLGMIHYYEHDYEQAYEDLMQALEINSALPDIWFTAGNCSLEMDNYRNAADCYTRVVAISPRYPEGWNNLAACHLHLQNNRAALGALEHATRLKRDSWKMWENMLHCALDLKEHNKALTCLERLADLRGTTDAGTLLPIQYTGSQAKLHMMAVGELTKAAEAEARVVSEKNAAEIDYTNTNRVIEQSLLSHRVIAILTKLESVAAAMVAADTSMGGRRRGGGVDAGAANSFTAALDAKKAENKAKLARMRAEQKRAEWKAKRGETAGSDSDSDGPIEGVEYNALGEPLLPSSPLDGLVIKSENANQAELDKISLKYQIFIQECLARVHVGVYNFTLAALAREKQCIFLVNSGKDTEWASKAETIDMVQASMEEAARLFMLAAKMEKHVEDTADKKDLESLQKEVGHLKALDCITTARYFADRVLTITQNAINSRVAGPTTPNLQALLKSCENQKKLIQTKEKDYSPAVSAPKDASDAYYQADDEYNSYW